MKKEKYASSDYYINRELSWVEFNRRVYEEAKDKANPLFERLKFSAIVSSNLDEFFMVRVASLWDQVEATHKKVDPAGLTPREQLTAISLEVHLLVDEQYKTYNKSLIPALKKEGIYFLTSKMLNLKQRDFIKNYYNKNIFPVLTPMLVDQSRPFPLIVNQSLNIAVLISSDNGEDETHFATVEIPSVLPRFIEIPSKDEKRNFILLEEIVKIYITSLYRGHNILAMGSFRIIRNADLGFNEEGAEDLLEAIHSSLKQRKWGTIVRLETEKSIDSRLLEYLEQHLEVTSEGIYEIDGPLDLRYLMKFTALQGYDHLCFPPLKPKSLISFANTEDYFSLISEKDILLHHPYDSFDPISNLVSKAAFDPDVLAIKQTLYRVSGKSPVVEALVQAAENGKQVTVLLEIKARFDEENNILWAKRLEQAGCHVIYGLPGLKVHCKMLLIVRREGNGIKRYVHLGTGNYNDETAKIYGDMGIFTSNPYIGSDVSAIFNLLSGYSRIDKLYKSYLAPFDLRKQFLDLIEQESARAKLGEKAKIIAKVNSLVDKKIIRALYEASSSGVKIELIVRGVCCLKPDIPRVSNNIKVRSIVGRFLEHSRIFYFFNGGNEKVYLSSNDWMERSLDRRIELLFPIEDEKIKNKIIDILDIYLKDNQKSRCLNRDGSYSKIRPQSKTRLNCQEYFLDN